MLGYYFEVVEGRGLDQVIEGDDHGHRQELHQYQEHGDNIQAHPQIIFGQEDLGILLQQELAPQNQVVDSFFKV